MPTAAKLFAAIAFFVVGFMAAEAFKPGMPEGTPFGHFSLIVGAIGGLTGWMVMGALAGRGYGASAGFGLRTSVTLTFWALLVFSVYQMIGLATKMRYDGPMDAIVGVFELMLENGQMLLNAPVLIALGVGGILGGFSAEWAARRWR
ncbi:MAG: TrgA family protein [Paracoccaceae bacterium]|nr:MAG: TrgA family protein [Paracoccaceae bacterium]